MDLILLATIMRPELFDKYPFLTELSYEVFVTKKTWYLDSHEFSKACVSDLISDRKQESWACQNAVEGRIQKKWWLSASNEAKADLLIHEVFRFLWLQESDPKPFFGAVHALLDPTSNENEITLALAQAGLPILPTSKSLERHINLLRGYEKTLCSSQSYGEALDALKKQDDARLAANPNDKSDLLFFESGLYLLHDCRFGITSCSEQSEQQIRKDLWIAFKSGYAEFFPEEKGLLSYRNCY
jgi:hypothetical protein